MLWPSYQCRHWHGGGDKNGSAMNRTWIHQFARDAECVGYKLKGHLSNPIFLGSHQYRTEKRTNLWLGHSTSTHCCWSLRWSKSIFLSLTFEEHGDLRVQWTLLNTYVIDDVERHVVRRRPALVPWWVRQRWRQHNVHLHNAACEHPDILVWSSDERCEIFCDWF